MVGGSGFSLGPPHLTVEPRRWRRRTRPRVPLRGSLSAAVQLRRCTSRCLRRASRSSGCDSQDSRPRRIVKWPPTAHLAEVTDESAYFGRSEMNTYLYCSKLVPRHPRTQRVTVDAAPARLLDGSSGMRITSMPHGVDGHAINHSCAGSMLCVLLTVVSPMPMFVVVRGRGALALWCALPQPRVTTEWERTWEASATCECPH